MTKKNSTANVNSIELKANLTELTNPTKPNQPNRNSGPVLSNHGETKPTGLLELVQSGVGRQIGCRVVSEVAASYNYFSFLPSYPATSLTQQSQQNSYPRCSAVVNPRCPVVGANDAGQVLGGLPLSIWPWASPGEPA